MSQRPHLKRNVETQTQNYLSDVRPLSKLTRSRPFKGMSSDSDLATLVDPDNFVLLVYAQAQGYIVPFVYECVCMVYMRVYLPTDNV